MVEKIFWKNPYLNQIETYVTSVQGDNIAVEQTIFYAFSGGQEGDTGTIGNSRVLQARAEGKEIIYTLDQNHGFKQGDPVKIKIDWERRYQLMRLHFAAEIVLELMYRNLESIKKIGAHIAQDKARMTSKGARIFQTYCQPFRRKPAASSRKILRSSAP